MASKSSMESLNSTGRLNSASCISSHLSRLVLAAVEGDGDREENVPEVPVENDFLLNGELDGEDVH
ncbi:hypothetical protein DCAR_0205713 [Daucus carota subsp. sativus]|uniref:Uncharacterized protein n=1 Tax=Daucus carota subsp. sativus TaxID=79200 RepID=A0A175YAD3_DAUCS|nr:hypothetical protein DCAR_0205713 [Daucus carota subsp. sativus]